MPQRLRAAVRDVWSGAPVLFALAGLAVTQPLLDLFGRNPAFFVAGPYNRRQIVAFALVIALVPPLVGTVAVAIATLIHRSLGKVVWLLVAFVFAGTFGLALARTVDIDGTITAFALAAAIAAVILLLERRTRPGRLLLRYLAFGQVLFLAFFLLASPTTRLLQGDDGGELGHVSVPDVPGPVVFVILDELPLTTIMKPDGTINAERYPNFARLSRETTWFRNASSLNSATNYAVPSLLSGKIVESGTIPSYIDHPRNLLTMFGRKVPLRMYEVITELCPPSICQPKPPQPLSQALDDARVVYGHRVLPADLRDDLPQIGATWGNFAEDLGADEGAIATQTTIKLERDQPDGPRDKARSEWVTPVLRGSHQGRQIAAIVAQAERIRPESAVHLIHVEAPHKRWTISPWLYANSTLIEHPVKVDHPSAFEAQAYHQLHAMQVGAVDRAIGDLIAHMEEVGAWDDALVVIASDHGDSTTPPDMWRTVTERNKEEVLRVPLFFKTPGQKRGKVVDDPALTIDVLPSIVDVLGVDTSWDFDGHSLFDGSQPTVKPHVDTNVRAGFEAAGVHTAQFAGFDWTGLAAVAPFKDLVGKQIAHLSTGSSSSLSMLLNERATIANLPTPEGKMPYSLTGTVRASGDDPPPELIVAINGRLAGVFGGYKRDGDGWSTLATVTDAYRVGSNTVAVYEVERSGSSAVLHPVTLE